MKSVFADGIPVKKKYGQHFLRDQAIALNITGAVKLDNTSSVMEIGCGDGFLTQTILHEDIARLWVFEIDPDWVAYNKKNITDKRLTIFEENILDSDFTVLKNHAPWTLLSNLPYQITFPILHCVQKNRHLFAEGVVMVQEEVAQKILKTKGRGYGYPSLFFQYYFDWKKLDFVPPTSFYPPPKVNSRLLYFKPKKNVEPIENEEGFWKFIKACFRQPRRTLKNNLEQTHYDNSLIDADTLALRAQQMGIKDFLMLWRKFSASST